MLEPADNFSFDLGNDTTLCDTDEILIFAPAGLVYLWQDGSTNQFYQINADDWNMGSNALILTAETTEGCSYTDAFVFNVDDCSGIEDIAGSDTFRLFPNPIENQFTITSDSYMHNGSIIIYDAAGRIVYTSKGLNGWQATISIDIPSGFYTAIVEANDQYLITPIIRK